MVTPGGKNLNFKKLSERKWYNGVVIACIGVGFYVLLTNLGTVIGGIGAFLSNFKTVFLGVVFAYVMNPLAKFFYYRLFKWMKPGKTRWILSVVLSLLTTLTALLLLLGMLIPQLAESITRFSENYESYAAALTNMLQNSRFGAKLGAEQFEVLTQNALSTIQNFVRQNAGTILSGLANSGKQVMSAAIAAILAVYLLLTKDSVLKGIRRLVRAILPPSATEALLDFLLRCDDIFVSYIGQSLVDALIVGCINAVFMAVFRMEYVGLVSVVVAVTNLVPNFGPAIGAVVGGFILLLVNPWHALLFVIFTALLQTVDGYILKPKLFGNSLGVSGLLILVSSIVFGNLFGVIGVLLAIPVATILSFVYRDYLLPRQEEHRQRANKAAREKQRAAEARPTE